MRRTAARATGRATRRHRKSSSSLNPLVRHQGGHEDPLHVVDLRLLREYPRGVVVELQPVGLEAAIKRLPKPPRHLVVPAPREWPFHLAALRGRRPSADALLGRTIL